MYDDLLKEYNLLFEENFPTFELSYMGDTEIVSLLEKCIEEKQPVGKYIDFDNDKIV